MATPLALVWDLIAHDNASAAFTRVGAAAGAASKETAGLGAGFAKMGGIIALAGVAVAAVTVKMATDFQESTTRLVTGAGESEKSIGMVRTGILDMAKSVGTMPEALSKGMYLIESAGYRGAKGLDVLKAAAEGAKVGGAEMSVVADGLTTAMTDYNIPTSQAALVTSKLVATVAAGKTNMSDLSASLSGILPFASSLGVKFNDITGAMATMTGEGIDAANASTMLRFTMMSLANETPKGKKALASIGMTAQQLKDDLSSKGVGGALAVVTEQIAKHFPAGSVKATQALAAIAGGTRGMGAALALTGTHAATLIANTKSIGSAAAEAGGHVKGWALTEETLAAKMDKAKAGIAATAIKIGTVLIPYVLKAIEAVGKLTDWFGKHKTATEAIIIVLGSFAAIAVTVKVALLAASVATTVWRGIMGVATAAQWLWNAAMLANPIGLVIVAIAALVGAVILIATKTTWFQTIWQYMTSSLAAAWQWLWNSILAPIIRFVLNGFATITDGIAKMLSVLSNIPGFGWAKTAADKMKDAADKAHALAAGIKDIPDKKVIVYTANWSAKTAAIVSAINTANKGHISVGSNAAGTDNWRGGLTWVGERGPEIVNLPRGAQVIPNDKLGAGSGGDTYNIYETVSAQATAMQVSRRQAALGAV
jgi:TP901 family phage tail tape measure protein